MIHVLFWTFGTYGWIISGILTSMGIITAVLLLLNPTLCTSILKRVSSWPHIAAGVFAFAVSFFGVGLLATLIAAQYFTGSVGAFFVSIGFGVVWALLSFIVLRLIWKRRVLQKPLWQSLWRSLVEPAIGLALIILSFWLLHVFVSFFA